MLCWTLAISSVAFATRFFHSLCAFAEALAAFAAFWRDFFIASFWTGLALLMRVRIALRFCSAFRFSMKYLPAAAIDCLCVFLACSRWRFCQLSLSLVLMIPA
ncbi:hypothetical protein ATCV1_z726R [Acanthocystis turfacea chlorella virus 1]|uniref:Uncharacterized protein z726R n=1 Tax=Chlorovirus heliozoae TaxID=322019 RepID=A7K9Y6_9PHYC|nr:hypothetical protein ATCV1_z726R [Acanthocystis turfacea chlorella virus 1]ABT16860.1 hypothetical protein ATCV1_z726R [Acanthocystis turfacea chlorella virus 1]